MKHSATPIRGILVTLSFILITLFNQLLAHVWEIRVNQNQDGSLTWYLQSYHTTSECGISNSGININGTNYPLQNNFTGSIQLLSNNIFTLSPSYANNNSARVSYATVTTPYISGSLNVTAYSNNVCWAAYFDMPVSNPNFRPQASALDFNGNTNYLNAGSSFLNNLSQFTIEGRIYYTGTASQSLFGQNDVLETSISGGQIEIWNPNFSLSVNHDMVINTWNHIAYVGNGSSITIYINGVQKGFLNHAIISNYSSSTHPVTIGSYTGDYIGGNAAPFNGKMDEIRFWNIARCQGEILNSLNCELSTINSSVLLAYYKLNQGFENSDNTAINIANDVSGNLRNASLVNFSLIGTTSNWTFGGVTGSCSSFSQSIMASNNGPVNTGSTLNLTATHTGTATYNWTGPNGFTSSVQNPSISNVQPNYSGIYSLSAVINGCSPVYSSTNVTINPPATALHFDGLNDNIELSNQFNNLSDITLAVWVKLNSYGSNGTGFSEIWSKESSNAFSINNSTRKFHVNFGNGTSWGTAIESSTIIPLNTWTHLAATRDALGNVKIYINGILNNSGNALNSLSGTNLLQHTVGCKQTPSGKTGFLNGSIDDLKVWSKALCESEINNNKNCEITTAQNNLILYLKLNNGFVNANNSGLITAIDYSGNGYNGTLIGFSLNGTTSNWTSGYVTGNCSAFSYPTINSFSGSQSICNGQSTTLTAHSSSPSPIFKWYDAALGGTLLFTGASYTTPILTANTNYYVEVSSLDCFSGSRTPVTVTVNPIPTITSTNTPQVRCGAGVVNLTATSSINSSTFNWYNAASGGASLFTGATYSPSISLNTTYYVATTSPQGCTSVARTPVVASVGPIYTANSSQCVNSNSFTFYNGCEVVGATYKWNFGDNTPIVSSLINTPQTHVYNAAGNYQVTLITTLNGIDSYSSMYVSVNPMPVASFVTYVNTGNGSSYSFQSSSTIQGGSMSYAWAFGDGNTGIGDNVQHIYANSGNKNVTLTVTSNAGCVNSTTSSINVIIAGSGGGSGGSGSGGTGGSGTNITPSFIVNNLQQCLTGNSFIFTNNSTYPSGTTFLWIFNDGTTYNGVTPLAKTYSTAGNYNVQLKATFNGNDYFTNQQVIVKPMPVAGFTYTNTGLQYSFTNTSTLSQGSMSYDWNINGSTVSTSQNIQATLNSGTNTVTLNATSDGGCTNSYGPISINASGSGGSGGGTIAPVSGITLSSGTQTQCLNGNSFTFSPNVSGGTPSTYQWYFQNATASSSTAAGPHTVTFSQPGTHTVQLYVSNSAGNSTATYNVTITDAPQPTIAAGSTTYFCDGGSVTLTSSAATSYQWYKDAVLISGATAQTYAATTAGVYTVVATYSGCASVASNGNSVTVVAAPSQPTIATSGATTFCNGSSVTLTSSTGNSYQWYLNGSTISGANGSTYNATATGNYTVAITNSNGCTSIQSTATSVTVNPAATTPVITA
ncbi:MAG: PKD domain-containing protein, partial [Chitinophagaceae bacterium]|nr:PKD domain-containing protein [Chitinophagaceae bacterium]